MYFKHSYCGDNFAVRKCIYICVTPPFSGAKFPFVMKLCFSSSRQIGQGKGQQPKGQGQNQGQGQEHNRQGQNNGLEHEY